MKTELARITGNNNERLTIIYDTDTRRAYFVQDNLVDDDSDGYIGDVDLPSDMRLDEIYKAVCAMYNHDGWDFEDLYA